VHAAHSLAGLALACVARDCAALRASAHRSGHRSPGARHGAADGGATVAEVEQGEALEHPRRRGHPPGKWVEAAAFFDEVGAPVAGGVMHRGGEEEEAQAQVYLEKKAARGAQGSAHLGGVRDGGGDQTTVVVRSDKGTALEQRHGRLQTRKTAWSGRARARRGEGSVGSAAESPDTGRLERLLTLMRTSGQRCPRQPTRARCEATLPLTAGPHTSALF
jgi:hypothetical protein